MDGRVTEYITPHRFAGLGIEDVAHILIPGRGRDSGGEQLGSDGLLRVQVAANLFGALDLAHRGGQIVCSGYKTPGDINGCNWAPDDAPDEKFIGVPEADLMKWELMKLGVPSSVIRTERHSIDTVTNLLRSEFEGYFGDELPVAIVAQEKHLQRILNVIAPRVLLRPYLGVIAPESMKDRSEGNLASLVSWMILFGLKKDTREGIKVAERRARRIWAVSKVFRPLMPELKNYHSG
jgi:hypothetical protein